MRQLEPMLGDVLQLDCFLTNGKKMFLSTIVNSIRTIAGQRIVDTETIDSHRRISFSINAKRKIKKIIKGPSIFHYHIIPNTESLKNAFAHIDNPSFLKVA